MVHQAAAGMRGKDVMGHGPQFPQSQTHTQTEAVLSLVLEAASPGSLPLYIPLCSGNRTGIVLADCHPPQGHGKCVRAFVGMLGISVQHQDRGAFLLRAAQEYEGTPQGGHLQLPQPHPWLPSPLQLFLKEIPSRCLRPWQTPLPHPVGLLVHFLRWEPASQLLMKGSVCAEEVTRVGSGLS